MKRALDGVGEVYHLAGLVSHLPADAHRMYAVHVDGTRVVCEAAARAGVRRIVMASTSGTVAVSRRGRRRRRRGEPRRRSTSSPAGPTTRASSIRKRRPGAPAATRWSWSRSTRACCSVRATIASSSTRPILQFIARDIALMPAGGLNVVDARDVAALHAGGDGARHAPGRATWSAPSTGPSPSCSAGSSA